MKSSKLSKIVTAVLITGCMVISYFANSFAMSDIAVTVDGASSVSQGKSIDIIYTSDLHSNYSKYDDYINGVQKSVGGFPRLKTLIDKKRAENSETLVLDCGDTVMGTLAQALIDKEAYELSFLCEASYDAITFGNHEFDFGEQKLSDMYMTVAKRYNKRPALVSCNIDWSMADEATTTLKNGVDAFGISDYVILEKNGLRIAVTGVLGKDAIKCEPDCKLTFIDPIQAVKDTVKKIKESENPDMIICLSHSGTGSELGDTEDENLAKEVKDLDLIISGHTHTENFSHLTVGDTHIVSCGAFGRNAGSVSLVRNSSGRWDIKNAQLILLDDSLEEDNGILESITELNGKIDDIVLKPYEMRCDDVIARNDIKFESEREAYEVHTENKLGNLLSDSYRYIANTTPTGANRQFDMAVVPSGTIRDTMMIGNINVTDAFSVLSLGTGPDGNVGYPLVSIYLTGKEVRTMLEVDASISDMMDSARLYTSGVAFEFNPKRMILNKTVDVWCTPAILEDSYEKIDNNKTYRIVVDSYSLSMLGAVTELSKGILSVVPKDENGNPIENYEDAIIYDKNGNELKAWVALAEYLASFSKNEEGISVVPAYYGEYHNRKVVNDSITFRALFKNTSIYFIIFVTICILIILLILYIIRCIVVKNRKKKVFIDN